jgi:CHAT domain-containing protein/cytochrome c-type biogenesis protein CcmH/NrfG
MIEEEDLIQDFIGDELTCDEKRAFKSHCPAPIKQRFPASLGSFFRSPLPAAALVAVLLIGLAGWFFFLREPAAQRATAALNQAYEQGRPLKSRITGFNYADFREERGENEIIVDQNELNSVFLDLSGQAKNYPDDAKSQHALGRFYLAKKDFVNAIAQFQRAARLARGNAEIYSDLGTAYLEEYKAALKKETADPTRPFEALENFEQAIRLDPRLFPPYFNRAICLQMQDLPNEAREAWVKYLELDPDSAWSVDARRNLNSLEIKSKAEVSADNKEKQFFEEFKAKNDTAAFQLASQNRELIRHKYLPQKIAMSFAGAHPSQRPERLAALKYLGRLEKEKIDDNFAADLANFYANLSPDKIEIVNKAQEAIKEGYRLCLDAVDYRAAMGQFKLARELFLNAGDSIEAHTVADYFIAYCIYSLDDRIEATRKLEEIGDFCERGGYKWFGLMNFYWSLGGRESLGRISVTESTTEYESGLQRAKEMGDAYMTQKFFVSLILKSDFIGRERETFGYIRDLLTFSNQDNLSDRQKFRNYDQVIQVLSESRFPNFAKAVALESASIAPVVDSDPHFAARVEVNAGIVFSQIGEYAEAGQRLSNARDRIKTLPEGTLRDGELARTLLNLGNLERKRNNLARAVEIYEECLRVTEKLSAAIPDKSKAGSDLYEVRKSRLLAFQAMGDDESVERDLSATIQLAEDYRAEILDEQERFTFFDNQQTVYDIAVDHEMRAGRPEEAFRYAETSNSRSLSDWLAKGARVDVERQRPRVLLMDSEKPLSLAQIRENMPPGVQVLQFRVLEDRVVTWLITRETFTAFSSPVKSGELKEKVENYVTLVKKNLAADRSSAAELSRELYRLLIQPVRASLDPNKDVCLIPNKILFYLPFASLSSPEGKYLIEEYTLSYSPGTDVFIRSTANAAAKANASNERLLGIGNPDFDGNLLPDLEDLPDAAKEAEGIGKTYPGSTVLTGRAATKTAFLAAYKDYDIIHIAGHYIVEPDSPLLSKLVLSRSPDGLEGSLLTNFDLMTGKLLKTRLVILSACQTGVEGYYGGEGLVGLSRTFLAVGAPLVVASAWKVDSPAASPLMQNFHRYRKQEGLSTVRALRAAQLDMLRDTKQNYTTPYYWAAFSAFGGYANY